MNSIVAEKATLGAAVVGATADLSPDVLHMRDHVQTPVILDPVPETKIVGPSSNFFNNSRERSENFNANLAPIGRDPWGPGRQAGVATSSSIEPPSGSTTIISTASYDQSLPIVKSGLPVLGETHQSGSTDL